MNAADRPTTAPVATLLVERYWPGVTVEAFVEAAARLADSVDRLGREGVAIRTVASTLVPSDEAAYWIVDGPSAAAIALAFAEAGITVDRTIEALELRPERGLAPSGVRMGGQDVDP